MKFKRKLAFLLVLVMCVSLIPTYSFSDSDKVKLTKTAKELAKEPGSYNIELGIEGVDITTSNPVDITLVIDSSASMGENNDARMDMTKNAAKRFAEKVMAGNNGGNKDTRIAVIEFASTAQAYYDYYGSIGVDTNPDTSDIAQFYYMKDLSSVKTAINNIEANGGTNTELGFEFARIFNNYRGRNVDNYVIFMTDGVPTFRYYKVDNNSYTTSDGNGAATSDLEFNEAVEKGKDLAKVAKVYTIGLLNGYSDESEEMKCADYLLSDSNSYNRKTIPGYWNEDDKWVGEKYEYTSKGKPYSSSYTRITTKNKEKAAEQITDAYSDLASEINAYATGTVTDIVPANFTVDESSIKIPNGASEKVTKNSDGTTTIEITGVNASAKTNNITYNVIAKAGQYGSAFTNKSATYDYTLTTKEKRSKTFEKPTVLLNPTTTADTASAKVGKTVMVDVLGNDINVKRTDNVSSVEDLKVTDVSQVKGAGKAEASASNGAIAFKADKEGKYTFTYKVSANVIKDLKTYTLQSKETTVTVDVSGVKTFAVNARVDNGGTINGNNSPYSKEFEKDKKCEQLSFKPASNYHIIGVTINGKADAKFDSDKHKNEYKYDSQKVTKDVEIVVSTAIDSFKVTGTIQNEMGKVTHEDQTIGYDQNAEPMVFTADTGYHFSSILVNGNPAEGFTTGAKTYSYTATKVTSKINIVATTEADSCIITGTIDNGGKIDGIVTATATKAAIYNTKGEMKFVPAEHYHITAITVGTQDIGLKKVASDGSYTYKETVTGNVDIVVTTSQDAQFAVSYDGNGADRGVVTSSGLVYKGDTIKTANNAFEKDYNTFKEWNTRKDGKGKSYAENVNFKVQCSTTLYAIWIPKVYTVDFDANGATGTAIKSEQGIKGTHFALADASESLQKAFHSFIGWSKDEKATTVEDSMKAGQLYEITGTETLFAVWKINQGTVSFDLNNGKGTTPTAITTDVQTSINLPEGSNISKDKSIFKGWSTTPDGMVLPKEYMVTGDIILYAVWQQTTFDVTYYVYKEEMNPKDHISHDSSKYTTKTDAWKGTVEVITGSGLDFINCTTSNKEFTALENINLGKTTEDIIKLYKDNYSVNQGLELVEGLTIVPFRLVDCGNGDIHVDCKIIPDTNKKFSVTYEPGTQGTFEKQTTTDLIYGTTIPAFTGDVLTQHNDGYEFAGWKVGETGTTVAAITGNVTGSVTYTAQWNTLNTEYTIEWYQQDVEGKTYEKVKTTTASALTGKPVNVTAGNDDIVGFDLNSAKSTLSADKLGMGTVLKVYYDREKYKVEGFLDGTSLVENDILFGATSPAIIFNAKENYHIAGVKVNDAPASFDQGKSYTYPEQSNVAAPIKVEVTTEIDQFTITASAIGLGTISSEGAITVNAGENAKYTITPETDSYLEDVKIDGESVNDETLKNIIENGTYTFTNISKNSTIEAIFEAKIVVTLTAKGEKFIYNGKEQTVEGFSTEGLGENLTIAGITAGAKGTNADVYVVTFDGTPKVLDGTNDVTRKYTVNTNNDSKLIILKRSITLTAKSAKLDWSGEKLNVPAPGYDITEGTLAEGQTISSITLSEGHENPGPYTTAVSNAAIGNFTDNYDIKYAEGKLVINLLDMSANVKATGYEGIYDGNAHGITVTAPEDAEVKFYDDAQDADAVRNAYVDVGTYTVNYTAFKKGHSAVTGSAVVTIKPAALTIAADSASKVYDGKALTDSGWQDTTPSGIVAGDVILYVDVTGSAINVGTVPNVASKAIIARFHGDLKPTASLGISKEASQASSEQELKLIREQVANIVKDYKNQKPDATLEEVTNHVLRVMEVWADVTSNYAIKYVNGTLTVNSSGGSGGHHHPTTPTPTAIIKDEAVPLGGNMQLNKTEHFNYVKGYNDGNVKPLNNITREEVATIFYRLLTESSRAIHFSQNENFSDIASSRWSLNSIATLANGQILTGYENGTFGATKPITRAEFAAIASRFDALEQTTDNQFSDVSNHWAKSYINSAAKKGWINGYEDGTFKPDQYITRAEAMTLINKVLERRVDAAGLMNGYKVFPDNKENAWYYYQVIEATNNHKYADRKNMSDMEKWAEILSDKTWNE